MSWKYLLDQGRLVNPRYSQGDACLKWGDRVLWELDLNKDIYNGKNPSLLGVIKLTAPGDLVWICFQLCPFQTHLMFRLVSHQYIIFTCEVGSLHTVISKYQCWEESVEKGIVVGALGFLTCWFSATWGLPFLPLLEAAKHRLHARRFMRPDKPQSESKWLQATAFLAARVHSPKRSF